LELLCYLAWDSEFGIFEKIIGGVVLCIFRPYVSSALFFKYNTALGPPYRVLVDTNFINFSIQNKVSIPKSHPPPQKKKKKKRVLFSRIGAILESVFNAKEREDIASILGNCN